eukprot:TRINITY_DN6825_c0_g1_i2.p1 TRINITY_DN6825_c0_g1~~TRINITY_DN6825_c0_g1_i2.p1  ORF type:complete len:396 (-),score=108.91 TRINITY_DN6825_c0_g1_i2:323-1510(-)
MMPKGLSWINNVYQKFEALCDEMDENSSLLLEETKTFVGKQVNVVGSNVKKFCAEVIQDILPPSPNAKSKNLCFEVSTELELFEKSKSNCKELQIVSVDEDKKNDGLYKVVLSEAVVADACENQFSVCIEQACDIRKLNSDEKTQNPYKEACLQISVTGENKHQQKLPQGNDSSAIRMVCDESTGRNELVYQEGSELLALVVDKQHGMQGACDCKDTLAFGKEREESLVCNSLPADRKVSMDCERTDISMEHKGTENESDPKVQERQETNESCQQCNLDSDANTRPEAAVQEILGANEVTNLSRDYIICLDSKETKGVNATFNAESLNPDNSKLYKESFIEVIPVAEDKEQAAFWYKDGSCGQSLLATTLSGPSSARDGEQLKHTESLDSEWELI